MEYLPQDPAILVSSINMLISHGRFDYLRNHTTFAEDIVDALGQLEKMVDAI